VSAAGALLFDPDAVVDAQRRIQDMAERVVRDAQRKVEEEKLEQVSPCPWVALDYGTTGSPTSIKLPPV
jgi:hypothetical protein